MATVTAKGVACQDCALILANDDDSGVTDAAAHRERMTAHGGLGAPGTQCVVSCDGEEDHDEFSSRPCDMCGTTDAGDRCAVTWLTTDKR